jgi:hypothetical protein|tara:strand:- start:1408 stop:1539 length:132 start_codon:yes stop_codon:yes gene_type:complete
MIAVKIEEKWEEGGELFFPHLFHIPFFVPWSLNDKINMGLKQS